MAGNNKRGTKQKPQGKKPQQPQRQQPSPRREPAVATAIVPERSPAAPRSDDVQWALETAMHDLQAPNVALDPVSETIPGEVFRADMTPLQNPPSDLSLWPRADELPSLRPAAPEPRMTATSADRFQVCQQAYASLQTSRDLIGQADELVLSMRENYLVGWLRAADAVLAQAQAAIAEVAEHYSGGVQHGG